MFTYLKLFYLYISYWLVGLEKEVFQYQKALFFSEIGNYHAAIHALKKAEKELKTSYVYGLMGWCYIQIEAFEKSSEYHDQAYETDDSAPILVGLAVSECQAGSISKSKEYLQRLSPYRNDPFVEACIVKLENEYAKKSSS